jgi:acetolactate synthase-1/2/3 large subunit
VDFGSTDFPALAEAFGGRGVTASNREDLAREFAAALDRKRFTLIACPIDLRDYDGRF